MPDQYDEQSNYDLSLEGPAKQESTFHKSDR